MPSSKSKYELGKRNFCYESEQDSSLIDVTSQNERVFAQLPDLIQEAAVSTEFSSPKLRISRVQNARTIDTDFMTQPMFFITTRTDSGIDLPDLNLTDEKLLGKYGSDLTANFADIRAYGSKAFFQKQNLSDGSYYSLCACATGYIWVNLSLTHVATRVGHFSDVEVQIGTYALKARTITTAEIPCRYKYSGQDDLRDGQLALLCSTVLAKYLRLRMMGRQYEEAAETAIKQSRSELSALRIVNPGLFSNLDSLLHQVCSNAPLPPTSDVSLISRSMITRRWQLWGETSILRQRYFFPKRIIHCFRRSRHDSIDLLSDCFRALRPEKDQIANSQDIVSSAPSFLPFQPFLLHKIETTLTNYGRGTIRRSISETVSHPLEHLHPHENHPSKNLTYPKPHYTPHKQAYCHSPPSTEQSRYLYPNPSRRR